MIDDHADVIDLLARTRVVPVVVLDDAADAAPLGRALVAAGLPLAEVTFRTSAAEEAIADLADVPDVVVGAGTVISTEQVDRAVDAGARFVVSPGLDPTVVEHCRHREVAVIPGVATATDLQLAVGLGLDVVKFFPAEAMGGIATVKALAAPFNEVRFVPTGGINRDNVADYLAHGRVLAVGGSWMVAPQLIRAGEWDQITSLAADAVGLVAALASDARER